MAARVVLLGLFFPLLLLPIFAGEPPKLPTAKTVTLSGKMKLSAALAELTKQTAIPVEAPRGEPDAEITVECKNVTFWQALDQIAAAANATVDLYAVDGKIALKKRTGAAPPKGAQTVSYDGLFRTSLKHITANVDLETGQTKYLASMEVAWEPALLPFYMETIPQNLVVQYDSGKQLPPKDLGNVKAPVDGRNAFILETALPTLPRAATTIEILEGKLSIVAPSQMLLFSFKEPLDEVSNYLNKNKKPLTMTQDNVECAISKVDVTKNPWVVTVTLKYPPGNTELGSYQSWVVNNELVLESKDGKTRFPATTYVVDRSNSTSAKVTYYFQDDPKKNLIRGKAEDWKLAYRTPASVVTIPISFSFKNVPLP
jgi:hypothetical protein